MFKISLQALTVELHQRLKMIQKQCLQSSQRYQSITIHSRNFLTNQAVLIEQPPVTPGLLRTRQDSKGNSNTIYSSLLTVSRYPVLSCQSPMNAMGWPETRTPGSAGWMMTLPLETLVSGQHITLRKQAFPVVSTTPF